MCAVALWCSAQAQAPALHFGRDGKFRIAQFTDVHLDLGTPYRRAQAEKTIAQMRYILDAEHPVPLSPTAFFRYVACPLRFYFYSVAGLAVRDEVADEVGFHNPGHFINLFKRSLGMTPGMYRSFWGQGQRRKLEGSV